VGVGVLDMRWIAPLPWDDIRLAAARSGRVLVVDETRHSGGVGEGVISLLVESGYRGRLARVASKDSFVPLGAAANHVLLGEHDIAAAARALLRS
jgi:2-oxoisovalerate dehydrogenase E1 component